MTIVALLLLLVTMPVGIFAESTEVYSSAITLHATVAETHPDFQIYGCTDDSFSSLDTAEGGGSLTLSDSSSSDVVAYFKLTQTNTTRYKGDLSVTFNPTALSTSIDGREYSTALPSAITGSSADIAETISVAPGVVGENNAYSANVSYLRADTVAAGTDIIVIGYKWDKDPSLNAGSYRGSVSVSVVSLD